MSTRRQLERLDASFESFLDSAISEVSDTELTPEKRRARLKRANAPGGAGVLAFCEIYFPKIFDQPWTDFHRDVAGIEEHEWFVSGFRRCGKSALVFIGHGIRRCVRGRELGPGIVSVALRTDDMAKERTAALSRLIQKNRLLMYDYEVEVVQDLKGHHIFGNTHLVAGSYQMGLRGLLDDEFKRIVLAICDDLYNRQTVDSERDNDKVFNFFTVEVKGQLEPGAPAIWLGNQITEDAPGRRYAQAFPHRHLSLPIRDEEGRSSWPEAYPDEVVDQMEADTTPEVWAGDYLDEPFERGDIFQEDWIRTVMLSLVEIVASVTACDPAFGKSPESCFKSLATLGYTSSYEHVLLDMYLRQESYDALFSYADELRIRFASHWKMLLFENDFEQWALAYAYYQMWVQRTQRPLPIITHYSRQLKTETFGSSKDGRILNLVHPYRTGTLRHAADLPQRCGADYDRYLQQYLAFGKKKTKLDGLDATATAFLMVGSYAEGGRIEVAPAPERLYPRPTWTGRR